MRLAIHGIEGRHVEADAAASQVPFGLAGLDAALGGGLPRGALHEVAAASEAEVATASGFALALARLAAPGRTVLWIAEDMALAENGDPYGPGLDEIGLAPERIVTVAAVCARDVLWAMEEALRCRAVGAVIGEVRKERIDGVAGRRLSLAAAQRQTPALLLRAEPDPRPIAAATRWIVGAARSVRHPYSLADAVCPSRLGFAEHLRMTAAQHCTQLRHGEVRAKRTSNHAPRHFRPDPGGKGECGPQATGPPTLAVRLVRNRYGRTGSWMLEWNRAEQRFDLAPAHPQPVAPATLDRPDRAAMA